MLFVHKEVNFFLFIKFVLVTAFLITFLKLLKPQHQRAFKLQPLAPIDNLNPPVVKG
jgi:hypothetical protein